MKKLKRHQAGITLVEFSIVGSLFLLLLFAILELAVYVYQLQSLNDISRRTARIAVVCPVESPDDIKQLVLTEGVPPGFTGDNIQIDYLDGAGNVIADPVANHVSIRFVQAQIVNFSYGFTQILSFLGDNGIVQVQSFRTVLPVESLGVLRLNDPDEKTDCSL